MQLRDLELFCEVAAQRSFSKAAKALGISQPVASETIKALEDRLGLSLINRSKRPLELTPAGEIYLGGARDLLESYRQLEDRVLQLRDKVREGQRFTARTIELFLVRPGFNRPKQLNEESIAKIQHVRRLEVWRIFWKRADGRWHRYAPRCEVQSLAEALRVIDEDASCCFFG